jgi:hypothetical protein
MAIVSGHNCADHLVVGKGHEKEVIINYELFVEDEVGAIVGGFVGEGSFPKCDYLIAMRFIAVVRDIHLREKNRRDRKLATRRLRPVQVQRF